MPGARDGWRRPRVTMFAIALLGAASLVQAPVAGAAPPVSKVTPQIGWIPFSGDVVVLNYMARWFPSTPPRLSHRLSCSTSRETRST
jgi:hypothetical protein